MEITDYHAKLFAHELTRQCASDEVDKMAPVLADAFLTDKLPRGPIQHLAERHPSRVVYRDRGFRDNDQLKTSAAKLFASKAGENLKKFKTV